MRKKLNLLVLLIDFFLISCTTINQNTNTSIRFNENKYDFKNLFYKKEVTHNFQFTNTGKTPLIIQDVKTSCGCTVPEWTKKPVKPGANGEIKIKYDAAFPGAFHKTITVFYNGEESPDTLIIKGQVMYPDKLEAEKE